MDQVVLHAQVHYGEATWLILSDWRNFFTLKRAAVLPEVAISAPALTVRREVSRRETRPRVLQGYCWGEAKHRLLWWSAERARRRPGVSLHACRRCQR